MLEVCTCYAEKFWPLTIPIASTGWYRGHRSISANNPTTAPANPTSPHSFALLRYAAQQHCVLVLRFQSCTLAQDHLLGVHASESRVSGPVCITLRFRPALALHAGTPHRNTYHLNPALRRQQQHPSCGYLDGRAAPANITLILCLQHRNTRRALYQ